MSARRINVLQLIGHLGRGGDTTAVLNAISGYDDSVNVDFITHDKAVPSCVERLQAEGHKIAFLEGDVRKLKLCYASAFRRAVEGLGVKYDVLHTHTSLQSGIALGVAKRMGIPKRICHSHVGAIQRRPTGFQRALLEEPLRKECIRNATDLAACSKVAGDFLFGARPYKLIYNGVDEASISLEAAKSAGVVRAELGCGEDTILVGQVARFSPMKNQAFTLALAKAFADDSRYKFVLVGDGVDFEPLKQMTHEAGLSNVRFTGRRGDVPAVMGALDCLLLPSLPGEGLPMIVLEAVAAGTPCMISNNVTDELCMLGQSFVKRLPLDVNLWRRGIAAFGRKRDNAAEEGCGALIRNGLNLDSFRSQWANLYR